MAKRKEKKRQPGSAKRAEASMSPQPTPSRPLTVPLAVPAYWTPDEALAVFELIDDLRDRIWSIYRPDLQHLMGQQRQPKPGDPREIDEDDLPF
jgi:hypothetical protein